MKNLKFLFTTLLLLVAVTYAQGQLWNGSISAVGELDAVNFNSPAAMDKDGNLYVTGTQTETFEFAGKEAEVLALGAYIAKYNAKGEELFAITLHGAIDITAITTDAENNFYVAGSYAGEAYITDVEGTDGEYETITNSEADYKTATFIAKYDANGNLLAVKSYEATLNAPMMDLYFGNPGKVSIEKIVADGSKVYAYFNYNGDIALNETATLVAKYVFAWGFCYLDCASAALISYDANLENPSCLAELAIAEEGGDATFVNSFNFAVEGDDVYVAAFGMGNLVLTTSAGSEAFDFEYDGMGTTEKGAIVAKVGAKAVKFSNIPTYVYAPSREIVDMEARDGNLYIAGTFAGSCAFDSTKVATGASDVFVASIDAEELTANWVYTNANDEGETNKYFEEVTGVVFDEENILVIDAVTDMNNNEAPVAKNYTVSYAGVAEETEAIAATAVAYNANAVAFINYTTATYITVYGLLDGCVFSEEDGVYTLVMYNGYKTELVLPVNYNGMNYVIGANAFKGKTSITSIVIPNSVTSIGDNAFYGCSGLKTVINYSNLTFSKGSSNYGYVAKCADKVINAPNGFIEGDFVWFENENGMTLVCYLGNATELTLPSECNNKSVTSIGGGAFSGCSGLTSVTIGNSVTSIGYYAFYNCSGLTSITIPNSVTSIGDYAFYDCSSLTSVTIGNSVTSIGNNAFSGCDAIEKLELDCETIGSWFGYKSSIKEIVLGNNVTSIGDYAFSGCSGLTSIEIPNSVTSIGDCAFQNCSGLTSVTIGNSVTSIGERVFSGCSGLASITMPNSVTNIGKEAFYYCSGLTSIEIPNSVTSIGESAFSSCSGLTSIEIPNSVTSIGERVFSGCSGLASIEIPNSVTSIGNYAFLGCSGLTSITIPNSVTSIASSAFSGCSGLTSVTIGNSVTSIGESAFYGCSGLTNIEIPNSVASIGNYAFYNCSGLTSVEIPNSVTSIGDDAFEGTAWYNNQSEGVVYAGKILYKYKGTMPENVEIVVNDGTLGIATFAFSGCSGLIGIEIPNSVTSIGSSAFYGCTSLKVLHIAEGQKPLSLGGSDVFCNCPLDTLYLGRNLLYDGNSPFREKETLKSVCIGTENLNENLFVGCSNISNLIFNTENVSNIFASYTSVVDITFTNRVKYIESQAFTGMSNLTNIMLETSTPPILSSDAFTKLQYKLIYMYVPAKSAKVYKSADVWKNFWDIQEMEYTTPVYTVTFMLDGDVYATYTLEVGAEIPYLKEPTKEGHTFSGWSEIPATMPAEDVVIEGTFTINSYAVIYEVDGEEYETVFVEYGAEIPAIEIPVKEGYTFCGWSEIPATMPAQDVVIEGIFTVNSYTVTFTVDGEEYERVSVEYGAEIPTIETPVKEGYTFSGWSEMPVTMPAEDITIEGSFAKAENGIEEIKAENEDMKTIYDLAGRKVANPGKGIYIINGKKVLVK